MNIGQLNQAVCERLQCDAVSMPALEARELIACALGIDRRRLLQRSAQAVSEQEQARTWQLVERRLAGEPLAYLLGEWDFYGLTFKITPDVLIPRSDTERLCELAIESAKEHAQPKALDLCSGSGCIGLALVHEVAQAVAVGVDVSPKAVAIAQQNARKLGLTDRYQCTQGDAMQPPPHEWAGAFDLMVCNPPYITEREMQELDTSVADYEPHLALYGGTDGLVFYRTIMQTWARCVKPGGLLLFECGFAQGQSVAQICRQANGTHAEVLTDYAGVPRIVRWIQTA